jgi:DeoR family transcriptional regulator, fructose operon transcriptional repressor
MHFQERKKKIIEAVFEAGSLSVFELSEKLGMSPATIRRDLHEITEEGLLLRTHGGTMKPDNPIRTGFTEKSGSNNIQKARIAEKAAEYVTDGDTVFLDCGSTVFQMCPHLRRKSNIRVITNSLPILAELIDIPGIKINLIGGELDKSRKAIHGDKAIEHVNGYHADKAFIGVDGISAENGLTAHSEQESGITTAFINNASRIHLLCDSSKIGKDSYIKFASLKEIDLLITDSGLMDPEKKRLIKNGLREFILV